jgi:hypothetical protein
MSEPKDAPIVKTINPGVNGDPLIMGLLGQLFEFDGHSGCWYSAVSTPSFQWSRLIQQYETCPAHSDSFGSGVGLNFFTAGCKARRVKVNVANPYDVNVGCSDETTNCLGSGVSHIVGGDYTFKDGSGHILAYNTFHQCSWKWYIIVSIIFKSWFGLADEDDKYRYYVQ